MLLAEGVFSGVVGRYDDEAVAAIFADQLLIQRDAGGVEVSAGLVEQEGANVGEDGQGQSCALLHAGREVADLLIPGTVEPNNTGDFAGLETGEERFKFEMELKAFPQGQLFDHFQVGGYNGAVAEELVLREQLIVEEVFQLAFTVMVMAADDLQQGTFAGAIRP